MGYTRPLENGNLLGKNGKSVFEITQEGKLVWQYTEKEGRDLHHDQERLANGNTLIVCNKDIMRPEISKKLLTDDCLLEVDKTGKIVWEWQTADHFNEFGFSDELKATIMNGYGEKTQIAMGGSPATKGMDWGHMNAASEIPASAGLTDPR